MGSVVSLHEKSQATNTTLKKKQKLSEGVEHYSILQIKQQRKTTKYIANETAAAIGAI